MNCIVFPSADPPFKIAMGNAGCVGTMGATLGGTVGPWQGILGLGIDALLSVRLVTASGSLVTASEIDNPELFWGLRGAGHNFGIVTSATFKVYDAPNNGNVTSTDFLYEGISNGSVWEALESFDDFMPNELSLTFSTIFNSSTSTVSIGSDGLRRSRSKQV
jgi:FAD/FMN-containing dehydrogenase